MSLSLSVGLLCKYTFVGLLPPIALLLAIAILRRLPKGGRLLWSGIGILALALPTGVVALQLVEAARVKSYHISGKPWLPKDLPPAMRWSDMLTLQKSDLGLL
jgi:4-amino-4-deoxy-L-arabinose transferase-like glycosyltransferase